MPGSFPFYSKIEPDLRKLLTERAGNNRPISLGGVSGLIPWIRVVSALQEPSQENRTAGGLVLDSIQPNNSFEQKYGSKTQPGIIGYELDLRTPVRAQSIDGRSRGLRPSPIVSSFTIDEAKEGTRKVTFDVVAYTLEQAEKLTEYLLEPGFHILVEWGWNTAKSRSQIVGGGGQIDPCEMAKYDSWKYIKEKRKRSNFHYDAMLGIIVGGGISLGDGETFNLQVEVQGIGSIAEYMQIHRSSSRTDNPESKTGLIFSPQAIEDQSQSNVGFSLFMEMVNNLPPSKQIPSVLDKLAVPDWSDQGNFINMDDKLSEILSEELSKDGSGLRTRTGKRLVLPSDTPLFSQDRFIRFELAVKILNAYQIKLEPSTVGSCKKKTRDLRIDISDTAISAFPHMFSTDKTKLYIPNTMAPNFNFIKALSINNKSELGNLIDFENLNKDENLQNLHPVVEGSHKNYENIKEVRNGVCKDYATGIDRLVPYAFPCRYDLNEEVKPINLADDTFIPPNSPKYYWGWLKDLYVNFDFFIETISKPNFIARDVFYELLNGMSSAVNSLWNFQIIETPAENEDGDLRLTVVDMNFLGLSEKNLPEEEFPFQARGTKSPFTSFTFDVDTPGAVMNSVIQKRMNTNIEAQPDSPFSSFQLLGNVFSNKEDKVGTIINSFSIIEEEPVPPTEQDTSKKVEENKTTTEEDKNLLLTFFTERAGVFPKIQDRNSKFDVTKSLFNRQSNDAFLEDIFVVGTWNDNDALSKIQMIDKGLVPSANSLGKREEVTRTNPPLGLAKVKFGVLGVSGFKVGDRITFSGIPSKFTKNAIYQITKVDHTISKSEWTTDITCEMRPVS